MTRSMLLQRDRISRRTRAPICKACASAALVVLAGCASGRSGLPSARNRDAKALRAEAQAAPTQPEPLYQLALLHYGQDEPDAALHSLRGALSRDADYVPALTLLAKLLHDCGRSSEGVRYFESRPAEAWPEPVRLDLALLYADVGNTMQARRILQGLEHGTYADAAGANLAYLDLMDDRNDPAATQLARLQERFRDVPEVLNNMALAKLRAGDVEGAAHLLQEIASQHPDFAPAQLNLALLLQNYLFDVDGARQVQAHFDAIGAPRLDATAMQQLFEPVTEDAAPAAPGPAPKETAPQKGAATGPKP